MALIRVATCGSVDDGKSTLLGRLLYETNSIPIDTIDAARNTRRPGSKENKVSPLMWLTDP